MIKPSEKMRRWKEEGGTGFLFVDSAIKVCEDYEAEVEAELAGLIEKMNRYKEALELIAYASDIRYAVPEMRQVTREALGLERPTPITSPGSSSDY